MIRERFVGRRLGATRTRAARAATKACSVPSGKTVTVYYGARNEYFSKQGVAGSVVCNDTTFGGDPISGTKEGLQLALNPER